MAYAVDRGGFIASVLPSYRRNRILRRREEDLESMRVAGRLSRFELSFDSLS